MLLLYVFPHISAQYVRYGENREQYNINNADRFNKCIYKIPTVFGNISHSHTGSYDFWIVRLLRLGQGATDRQFLLRSPAAVGGRAITNDWRISMARAIAGNRTTSGSDQRPTDVRSIVAAGDRWYDQSIVASCDRSYEQSWHTLTDSTSTRDIM